MQESTFDALVSRRLHGDKSSLPDDDEAKRLLPLLWTFLTRTEVDAEHEKDTASISIRRGFGAWLCTLTDPSLEVSLTVQCPTLAGALACWDAAAGSSTAAWVPWKGSKGKIRKKSVRTPGRSEAGS
jgi:hypothetical protein